MAEELREVYEGDVEKVDLLIGCLAEPLPAGFGFSDTAFRVFILMASRRLKSDRFIAGEFKPEVYTREGIDWVSTTSRHDVPVLTLRAGAEQYHERRADPAFPGIESDAEGGPECVCAVGEGGEECGV